MLRILQGNASQLAWRRRPEFPANRLPPETFEPGLQGLRPPNGSVEARFSENFLQQVPFSRCGGGSASDITVGGSGCVPAGTGDPLKQISATAAQVALLAAIQQVRFFKGVCPGHRFRGPLGSTGGGGELSWPPEAVPAVWGPSVPALLRPLERFQPVLRHQVRRAP